MKVDVPTFSICIPTYRNHVYLRNLINSIALHTHHLYELVIADNSFEAMGFAKAVNDCLKRARGDYVVIMNDDVEVKEFWLDCMFDILMVDLKNGLVGHGAIRDDGFGTKHVAFYCVLLPKKVIEKVGLLDEVYGIGCWEDVDYCKRIWDAGYKVIGDPNVPIVHYGSHTFNKIKPMEELVAEGKEKFKKKWGFT